MEYYYFSQKKMHYNEIIFILLRLDFQDYHNKALPCDQINVDHPPNIWCIGIAFFFFFKSCQTCTKQLGIIISFSIFYL